MKVAILVDELPTSSAPKIVGEEAFHMTELGIYQYCKSLYNKHTYEKRITELISKV